MKVEKRFVGFIVEHPWKTLVVGFLLFFVLGPGGQKLYPDFTYRVWFNDDDPLMVEFDAFERRFGNDDRAVVIVHSPSGIFDQDSMKLMTDLTDAMWLAPDVIRVDSIVNFNWVHSEEDELMVEPLIPDDVPVTDAILENRKSVALNHETLPDYMVSKDGTIAILYATTKPVLGGSPDPSRFLNGVTREDGTYQRGARAIADALKRTDHEIMMTGGPVLNLSFKEAAQKDIQGVLPFVFGLVLITLLLLFRRLSGLLIPILLMILSIGSTMGLGGFLGYSINNMTAIVPQVLMAIVIADIVHVLVSFYRPYDRGMPKKAAVRHSLQKNFVPTVLTSISTAIGFFSFSQANIVPIGQMGMMAGLGTLIAWFFTFLVAGPLLVILPIRSKKLSDDAASATDTTPRARRSAAFVARFRRPIIAVSTVVIGITIILASKTQVNSDPFMYFPDDSPMNRATTLLEDKVGGATNMEIVVDSGEEDGIKEPKFMTKVSEFQDWLDSQDYISSNTSLVDILKSMNRSLNNEDPKAYVLPDTKAGIAQQFLLYTMGLPQGMDINDRVSVKSDAIRITSAWTIHDSVSVLNAIDVVEAKAAEMGLKAHITGKTQLWQGMNPYVVRTFVISILTAIVLMSLLMIVVFRSFSLGMLAMLPNLFPLLLGAALLRFIDQPMDMGAVLSFSFCLGIAVDDTVHFMANYVRLKRDGYRAEDAVAHIFAHTVPALLTTTIILVIAFGAFMFATFLPNRNFGLFVAVILSLALITDLTLLPALLMGKKGKKGEAQVIDDSASTAQAVES